MQSQTASGNVPVPSAAAGNGQSAVSSSFGRQIDPDNLEGIFKKALPSSSLNAFNLAAPVLGRRSKLLFAYLTARELSAIERFTLECERVY